jgi:cytoskeletal protein CcmA (bactofilin family)
MERSDGRDKQGRDTMSIIGPGVMITGDVECSTDLQIEGRVAGEVRCSTLFVGEDGCIEGTIQAERVRVSGKVEGAIFAGDLGIEASAHVKGELVYSRLKVTAGGVVEGTLKHRAADAAAEGASLKLVEPPPPPQQPAQPRRVYVD